MTKLNSIAISILGLIVGLSIFHFNSRLNVQKAVISVQTETIKEQAQLIKKLAKQRGVGNE